MKTVQFGQKTYRIDDQNFLKDPEEWDRDFAVGMARQIGMAEDLTAHHWDVIHFIRDRFKASGTCPVVFETTRALHLDPKALQELFPTGYFRGACLLAGISYKYGWVYSSEEPWGDRIKPEEGKDADAADLEKVYRVNLFGFLADFSDWDEAFAKRRAYEMNMKNGLREPHWEIIHFLREHYRKTGKVPTIYECCEANGLDFDQFGNLFPAGYHRGAIKIAGLPG